MTYNGQECDVLVLGAGIYGVQAARTYLEIHPKANVVIVEASSSIGGVWSSERNYDDFWTQTPIGMAEFSDKRMHDVPADEQYYGFFKASHVTKYLNEYVDAHVYNGTSIRSRIVFDTMVEKVNKVSGIWSVKVSNQDAPIYAHNIVDATGLTSRPNIPNIKGLIESSIKVVHHKDFGEQQDSVLRNDKANHITIIGGAKSAADMVYAAAKTQNSVSWIIRKTGRGPSLFVPAKGRGFYRNSNDLFYTRATALFLASLWSIIPFWLHWLYQSKFGMKVFGRIWANNNKSAVSNANYDRADGVANGFYNLRPDTDLFWQNDSTSINQRQDFFDVIASGVKVYRQDIKEAQKNELILEDGTVVKTDVALLGTGWDTSNPCYDVEEAASMGLPVLSDNLGNTQLEKESKTWEARVLDAETKVVAQFPVLKTPPGCFVETRSKKPATTPYKLYKSVIPTGSASSACYRNGGRPSIVFLGRLMLGNHFRAAEAQALFAVAALDGNLPLLKLERRKQVATMEDEVAMAFAWCRRRYPGKVSELGNWFYFDMVPYTDDLLETIGLKSHRHNRWWEDMLKPCRAADLKHCIQEYKDCYKLY